MIPTTKKQKPKQFWKQQCSTWSDKLWFPKTSGSVGSYQNKSSDCTQTKEYASWVLIHNHTIKKPPNNTLKSSECSLQITNIFNGEESREKHKNTFNTKLNQKIKRNEKKEIKNRLDMDTINKEAYIPSTIRVQLYPNKEEKKNLDDWIAATRKLWNICLNHIKINKLNPETLREDYFRDLFLTQEATKRNTVNKELKERINKEISWTFRTPRRTREYAIIDLLASYKSCETQLKTKNIKKYIIKPKSKQAKRQNISVSYETSYILNGKLRLSDKLSEIKMAEKIPDGPLTNNGRIVREAGYYYINLPRFVELKKRDCIVTDKIASIDLGVNIFGVSYNPDGEWSEIGINMKRRLQEIYDKESRIEKKLTGRKRNKAIYRWENKIVNLINDAQYKMVHWLLSRNKHILISRLYVRRVNKQLKRLFNDMRHCQFVDRLKYKAMFYEGRTIHEIKEHYTSSVCTKCGSMNVVKGKTIKCNKCGWEMHRDLSGSIAIIIKHL